MALTRIGIVDTLSSPAALGLVGVDYTLALNTGGRTRWDSGDVIGSQLIAPYRQGQPVIQRLLERGVGVAVVPDSSHGPVAVRGLFDPILVVVTGSAVTEETLLAFEALGRMVVVVVAQPDDAVVVDVDNATRMARVKNLAGEVQVVTGGVHVFPAVKRKAAKKPAAEPKRLGPDDKDSV